MRHENKTEKTPDEILKSTATELAEEAAILSTMSENIAIANKNIAQLKNRFAELRLS